MRTIFISLVILHRIHTILASSCPTKCDCSTPFVVKCQYEFLDYVPSDIPAETTQLYLDGNFIEHIETNKLSHLVDLRKLSLTSNIISKIDDDAFLNFTKLTHLYMNGNRMSHIKKTYFQNMKSLQELRLSKLSQNSPLCIDDYSFENLQNLQKLYLSNNGLVRVSNKTFYGLQKLLWLDLSANNLQLLSSHSFSYFTSLTIAEMSRPFCCCQTLSAITESSVSLPMYTCIDYNNTEWDITTRTCMNDGDICGSIRESTCKIWPPIEESIIVPLSTSSAIASIVSYSPTLHLASSIFTNETAISSMIITLVTPLPSFAASSVSTIQSSQSINLTQLLLSSQSTKMHSQRSSYQDVLSTTTTTTWSTEGLQSSAKTEPSLYTSHQQIKASQIITKLKSSDLSTPSSIRMVQSVISSTRSSPLQSSDIIQATKSSKTPQPCSNRTCSTGCTFSTTLCKCVQTGTEKDCTAITGSQTSKQSAIDSTTIALITSSVAFLVLCLLFVYLKKRQQRRDRQFNMQPGGVVEMRNNGNDNNGFIIEGHNENGSRPAAELY